ISDTRGLKVNVVNASASGAGTTASNPTQYQIIVHVDADTNRQPFAARHVVKELVLQKSIQPSGLSRRAWKPIQNESAFAVCLPQTLGHHAIHELVGNQVTASHDVSGFNPYWCAALHLLAQNVTGGNLRHAVVLGDTLGLRALAGAGRTRQDVGPVFLRPPPGHPAPQPPRLIRCPPLQQPSLPGTAAANPTAAR